MPAKVYFPTPPTELMVPPSDLALLPEGRVLLLSQIVNVAKTNNIVGFEAKTRLESLQNWVTAQQEIFNK